MAKKLSTAERLGDAEKRYYGRVVDLLKERDEEEGSDSTFTENVLSQIESDGVRRVFCDKEGSRAVEWLLKTSDCDAAFLKSLLEPIAADFDSVAKDRCGSHPMEALLKAAGRQLSAVRNSSCENLEALFLQVFRDIKTSLGDLLTHPYASHVVCAAVQGVSGVYVADRLTRSRYSREFRKVKLDDEECQKGAVLERSVAVPETFMAVLNKLGRWVCKLSNFPLLLVDAHASPVLQVTLRVLMERAPMRGNRMIRKVIESVKRSLAESDEEDKSTLPQVFTCNIGSHLMDVLLELASADLHQWIWETCFKERVPSFALHPVANYPLQQFMAVADSVQVAQVISELLPHLEDVLYVGHSGVVVKVAEAGLKSPPQQPQILQTLLEAFHADKDTRCCVPLLLTLTAYEVYSEHKEKMESDKDINRRPVHVHGSLMVQALLKYENPRAVVRSILHMDINEVMWLSCDVAGSHVIDGFLTSPTVTSVKKGKLVHKIVPHLVPLCKDKHGSRVMDAIWRNSQVTVKESLAEELLAHEAELADDFYGRIVMRNCNIAHYRRKQAVWQKESAATNPRELFRDIFEEESTATVEGRRKRKTRKVNTVDVGVDTEPVSSALELPQSCRRKKRKKSAILD